MDTKPSNFTLRITKSGHALTAGKLSVRSSSAFEFRIWHHRPNRDRQLISLLRGRTGFSNFHGRKQKAGADEASVDLLDVCTITWSVPTANARSLERWGSSGHCRSRDLTGMALEDFAYWIIALVS